MSKEIKVTLIYPPKPKSLRFKARQWLKPLSLHYLAAWLEKHDFKVNILDFEKGLVDESKRVAILQDNPSDLFGITAVTYTRFEAIDIARDIKRLFPKSVVMVGGAHFTFVAEDTMVHSKDIDIVCEGEGEYPILNVARALASGKSVAEMDDIPGIVFRRDGKIVRTPPQPIIKDIDQFPFYTKFTWEDYPEYVTFGDQKLPATTIITSRGCPHKCTFCSIHRLYTYRVRSASNVVDEIEYFIDRFGLKAVNFYDPTFAASPKHVRALVNEMINRKVDIKWHCDLRADTPLELLPLMKEAGLASFVLGIESGSPKIVKSIAKGIDLEQVEVIVERAEQLDIKVFPFFMLSHPDETLKDALKTLEFRNKIKKHRNARQMTFTVTMIFPGTYLERLAKERGVLPKDFSWSSPYKSKVSGRFAMGENVPVYLEKLTPSQIERILKIDRFNSIQEAHSFSSLVRAGIYTVFGKRDFRSLFNYFSLLLNYLSHQIRQRLS